MFNLKEQTGAVIILAILVMSVVVTISLAVSLFIISEIKQTKKFDQSIVAYYAAESGIERSLFQARKDTYDVDEFNLLSEDLLNDSSYKIASQDSEPVIQMVVPANQALQLDLFNPNIFEEPDETIKSINLDWTINGTWQEVNWVCWNLSGQLGLNHSWRYSTSTSIVLYNQPGDPDSCYLYRVRIIPRYCENCLTTLYVTAYSQIDPTTCEGGPAGCQVDLPGRIIVKSTGKYPARAEEAARQAIQITMPRREAALPYFDYVLFSEGPVRKEVSN